MISLHGIGVGTLVSAIALAGCASEPKAPPGNAVAPAAQVSWDGTYRGTIQVTGTGSGVQVRWCETDPRMVVQVTGNSFSYSMPHPNAPDNPTPVYSATIAPNGIFRAERISGVMHGQVAGTHMSGTVDGSVCVYAFSADRS